jgi:ferrous iron transport protein B
MAALADATATIPENLGAVAERLLDPLGLDVGDVSSIEAAAREQEVSAGMFGAMAARFDGQAGAFAYLLFILLYFPCVATIGAIAREAGSAWAAFVAVWTTTVAYTTSTLFYQAATFAQHPATSLAWILAMALLAVSVVTGLRIWSGRGTGHTPQASGAKA